MIWRQPDGDQNPNLQLPQPENQQLKHHKYIPSPTGGATDPAPSPTASRDECSLCRRTEGSAAPVSAGAPGVLLDWRGPGDSPRAEASERTNSLLGSIKTFTQTRYNKQKQDSDLLEKKKKDFLSFPEGSAVRGHRQDKNRHRERETRKNGVQSPF